MQNVKSFKYFELKWKTGIVGYSELFQKAGFFKEQKAGFSAPPQKK